MPYELSDLIAKRVRTVHVPIVDDETLAVRYSPDAMTPEVWARLQGWVKANAEKDADPFEVAEYVIEPLVSGWDITTDGEPYAVTRDNIVALGLPLVAAISGALMTDFNNLRDMSGPKGRSNGHSSPQSIQPADSLIGTSP